MLDNKLKRRTKIVCTLGPASNSPEVIEKMLNAGMNIARFNLAHGTLAEHSQVIKTVRQISQKLGLNTGILPDLPGLKRKSGTIKEVFREHLQFALSEKATFVALSFISSADQVKEVKALLKEMKAEIPLIVKIEKPGGLEDADAILDVGDGIMVARGDLGLQINIEKVPLAQKLLIKKANQCGKPVITATEMLESMVGKPTPTRAEATDVANAVLDGTDAVMTSEETTIGKFPVTVVETMARIVLEAEPAIEHDRILFDKSRGILPLLNDATAKAACQIAEQLGAKAIVTFTTGGTTALRVSKYRPAQPIIAVTPNEHMLERLSLPWGVFPVLRPEPASLEKVFELASDVAVQTGAAQKDDLIIITAGLPLFVPGNTCFESPLCGTIISLFPASGTRSLKNPR